MNRDQLLATPRLAGQVLRYHTWPVHRQQSVGEHTWQVMRIYCQIWGAPSADVLTAILWHDAGELVTGDPPFPFKARHPDIKKHMDTAEDDAVRQMGGRLIRLSLDDQKRVKTCDLIDMLEFGLVEVTMGNQYARPIVDDIYNAICKLWRSEHPEPESEWARVFNYITSKISWEAWHGIGNS